MRLHIHRALPLLLLSCLSACGTSQPLQDLRASAGGFALRVWPESFMGGAAQGEYTVQIVEETAAGVTVEVGASSLQALRALYFTLDYDAQRWNPLAAETTGAFGSAESVLSLPWLVRPGSLDFGQVLRAAESPAGITGAATLARLRFARGPFTPDGPRSVSRPPLDTTDAPLLCWDRESEPVLRWAFGGVGDYDQNGEVNIADLTPLGLLFRDSGAFPALGEHFAVDGDANGEINLADITPIGLNYGRRVDSYRVYALDPLGSGEPPAGGVLIAELDKTTALDNARGALELSLSIFSDIGLGVPGFSQPRDAYFSDGAYRLDLPDAAGMTDVMFCVVPVSDGTEGSASNLVGGPALQLTFTLDPPAPGAGSVLSPFILTEQTEYQLHASHPTLGDVSTQLHVVLVSDELLEPPGGQTSALRGASDLEFDYLLTKRDVNGVIKFHGGELSGDGEQYFATHRANLAKQTERAFNTAQALVLLLGIDKDVETNLDPNASLAANPPIVLVGQQFQLDASGSNDPDGFVREYSFDLDDDFQYDDVFDGDAIINHVELQPGVYHYSVQVKDYLLGDPPEEQGSDTADVTVEVRPNPDPEPPSLLIDSPENNAQVGAGSPINVAVFASDANGVASVAFSTTAPGAAFVPPSLNAGGQANYGGASSVIFPNPGTYGITVTATDLSGRVATQTITVTAVSNLAPLANLQASKLTALLGEAVTLDGVDSTDSDGVIVAYRFDFENDGAYDAEVNPPQTSVQHSYTAPGSYLVTLQVEDDKAAISTAQVELTITNQLPTAEFAVSPNPAQPGENILFDAGASLDPDTGDSIRFVRFDFDDNGDYEVELDYSVDPTTSRQFAAPGIYPVACVAEDQFGGVSAPSSANVTVQAAGDPDWIVKTVDGATLPDIGINPSLAVVNGHPAIACKDATNGNPVFIRSLDPLGNDWSGGFTNIVTSADNDGDSTSLTLLSSGTPAVSFENQTDFDLQFATALNINGSAWNMSVVAAGGSNPGYGAGSELTIVNGKPAVGFFGALGTEYVHASQPDGSAWNSPVPLNTGFIDSLNPIDMFFSPGLNAPVCVSQLVGDLAYSEGLNTDGSSWDASRTVEALSFAPFKAAHLPSGMTVFYWHLGTQDIVAEQPTDPNRDVWSGTPIPVLNLNDNVSQLEGEFGDPQNAFLVIGTDSGIFSIHSVSPTGLSYGALKTIDANAQIIVRDISTAVLVGGAPCVAFFDEATKQLLFARFSTS